MKNKSGGLSSKLLQLFAHYISLNTSLPSGENYPAAIALLQGFLDDCGFATDDIQIPESIDGKKNRVNLIARKYVSDNFPTILMYNHIDTVPANYSDAYTLTINNGKAYGRGAADHKGSTIAVLDALEKLNGKKLRFNLIFLATCDEETDQTRQLDFITLKLKFPKNTVIFDPDTFAGGISIAHLGHLAIELVIKGKSSHSAMSYLGINAIEKSNTLIGFFLGVQKEYEKNYSKFPPFPFLGISRVPARCNVNMISGGIAQNVIPDSCTITIDCRFIPEANTTKEKDNLLKRIAEFAKKNTITYEIKNTHLIEGYASDNPLAHQLNELYKKITGEGGMYCVTGSTPIAQWCKEQKLAHFGVGVVRKESNIHGVNEFAYLKDIENLSKSLQLFFTSAQSV